VRTIDVIERPSDLTAEWLTASVGADAVADFGYERIGTGQMSECYRVAYCRERAQADTPGFAHILRTLAAGRGS
jgi:hypothetical protein